MPVGLSARRRAGNAAALAPNTNNNTATKSRASTFSCQISSNNAIVFYRAGFSPARTARRAPVQRGAADASASASAVSGSPAKSRLRRCLSGKRTAVRRVRLREAVDAAAQKPDARGQVPQIVLHDAEVRAACGQRRLRDVQHPGALARRCPPHSRPSRQTCPPRRTGLPRTARSSACGCRRSASLPPRQQDAEMLSASSRTDFLAGPIVRNTDAVRTKQRRRFLGRDARQTGTFLRDVGVRGRISRAAHEFLSFLCHLIQFPEPL